MTPRLLPRLLFAAFVAMWFLSIARDPNTVSALGVEMSVVEHEIVNAVDKAAITTVEDMSPAHWNAQLCAGANPGASTRIIALNDLDPETAETGVPPSWSVECPIATPTPQSTIEPAPRE